MASKREWIIYLSSYSDLYKKIDLKIRDLKKSKGKISLINEHELNKDGIINPLMHSVDSKKHPDMNLIPVWLKSARGVLESYKDCI
ncbi:MAG: hypothetical protein ACTSVC_05505 [Promethearchaeota archaeon]